MQALRESGDVTGQIVQTPAPEKQLHQQQGAPRGTVNWTATFKETNSVAVPDSILRTVTQANFVVTSAAVAMGGEEMNLVNHRTV